MSEFVVRDEETARKLFNIAMFAGKLLLESGAEIYRVESTIEIICKSYENIDSVEVFVTPTAIFVSMKYMGNVISEMIRVYEYASNLRMIHHVNDFSRKFCFHEIKLEEAEAVLKELSVIKPNKTSLRSLGAALGSGFFCLLFGGEPLDFLAAFAIGFFVFYIMSIPKAIKFTFFFDDFMASFLSAVLAFLLIEIGIGKNVDQIIIGTIMPYIPGVSLTTAIRDTMAGDSISGLMQLIKAILTAVAIAMGCGLVIFFFLRGL